MTSNDSPTPAASTHHSPVMEVHPETLVALKAFALDVVPFFQRLEAADLRVTTIKGGTTNQLYLVRNVGKTDGDGPAETSESVPNTCVIRVYGKGTDKMISRKEELFWQGQFLETYGNNGEMLAYEFLEGFRALSAHEFYPRRVEIARRVCAFHAKATQASIFHLPISMEAQNHTMIMLTKWVDLVRDVDTVRSAVSPAKVSLFDKMDWQDGGLLRERDWIVSVIEKNIRRLPVAVCHNDLTCGNFMVNEASGQEELRFIDFEYTRLNFIYFDLANHFNEYGGLECDFTKFPDRSVIAEFVREYFVAGRKRSVISGYVGSGVNMYNAAAPPEFGASPPTSTNPFGNGDAQKKKDDTSSHTHHPHDTKYHHDQQRLQQSQYLTVTDAEVEEATDLVLFFTLVSHFVWAIWGVVQEQVSDIDFGFMDYGWSRWAEYMKNKEAFSKNII